VTNGFLDAYAGPRTTGFDAGPAGVAGELQRGPWWL